MHVLQPKVHHIFTVQAAREEAHGGETLALRVLLEDVPAQGGVVVPHETAS